MSAHKLTRLGALNATRLLDQAADLIQLNASVLGIPDDVALDFAKRADILSDVIEKRAIANFPLTAADGEDEDEDEDKDATKKASDKTAAPEWSQPAKNETGKSLPPGNGGWDPNAIADDRGGPYVSQSDESSYMAGHFAQDWFNQLRGKVESNTVPRLGQVDKFAAAGMAMNACLRDVVRVASSEKMADAEFRDSVQQLTEINRVAAELQAQITAAAGISRKASQHGVAAGFESLISNLKAQSSEVTAIHDSLVASSGLVPHTAADVAAADAQFAASTSEAIGDLWDAVQKQTAGFQRAAAKLQDPAGPHAVVGGALSRLFGMGSATVTGAKERVAKSFATLQAAYNQTHGDDRALLRRLLAEEGLATRLAGDDEDDDTTEDEPEDDKGKTASINLFE